MRKKIVTIIVINLLVIIFSSICQANIAGIFPADWGMSVEEVKEGINSSQDFKYVGEDFTEDEYRTTV